MSTALILSGGAPNLSLISGALHAFEEKGVKFDVISSAGAGAIAGLAWMSPKDSDASEALKNLVNLSMYDTIYRMFPVDYKLFGAPGPWSDLYRVFLQSIPWVGKIADQNQKEIQRLFSDWVLLLFSMFCPAGLTPYKKGLFANASFVSGIVDFEKIREIGSEFYINAYNITDRRMEMFSKNEIGGDHFLASLSFPFLYPPHQMNGKFYFEGAARDCMNFKSLLEKHPEIDTIVVFDTMDVDKWMRTPRNLYDAWVLSIIVPLVAVAKDDMKIFEIEHNTGKDGKPIRKLLKIPFEVPEDRLPHIMDWSGANLRSLFEVGREAGMKFYETYGKTFDGPDAKNKD